MNKLQLKTYADFFGKLLPLGKIKDSETRKEVVLLAASLRKYGKEIEDDLETIRVRLTEGHEEEINKWVDLVNKAEKAESEKEKEKFQKEAEACAEAVRINNEYKEATSALFGQDAGEINIHKVDLTQIVDAVIDAGVYSVDKSSLDAIATEFKDLLK